MTSGFLVWIFAISTMLLVDFVIFYPMEIKGGFPKEQFLELLMKALRMGLIGSILSTFGGICGTLWNSAYMAYGIPFVSYYFGIILHERYFKDQIWFYPVEWILADGNWGTDKAGLWLFLLLKKVGLDPDMKKPVGKYSLGMRQRLGIAQAIMEDPRFLILDEPFNGLDKHGVAEIRELLLDLKAAGKTILLASHNDEDIRILCDHVYEMDGGVLRERTA